MTDAKRLRRITSFAALVDYLRDELDWPIETEDADEITFEYEPDELGIDPSHAVKIKSIRQIRPLVDGQPWGVFFVEFESKRLPVVVLRRILRAFVARSRRNDPDRPVWALDDLLFISALGEVSNRGISFAHFRQGQSGGRQAELRTFSWDSRETHFYYLKTFNLEQLRWPDDNKQNPVVWREQWRRAFPTPHRYVIKKSQELAREMAHHAAVVRSLVAEVYRLEVSDGPLHQLFKSFKAVLLHDLTPKTFADMVAQTVAYGLFSAATQKPEELDYEHLVELIPNTNPFLKELLAELTQPDKGGLDLEELGVDQLVALLRRTDMSAIVRDFGRQTGAGREDPVVHFYELFLSEYDKDQKVQRGVFYTPDPVVSYIVRSVDYLLKEEFGLPDGLADTTVNPETGEPWVQILDPATGTGTFLAHVIDQIEQTVKGKPGADWNDYVTNHLLPRLNGFELLMAPYAVAHMKLGLKLKQSGYNFAGDERLRIYLGNALEEPVERHETLAMTGFLSKESNEAARVKRRIPVTVVLGNPPYSGHSANDSEWIAGMLRGRDGEGRQVENYFEVDGKPLGERNPKYLNDDYVKFIRFGQWKIKETNAGILAFITNHGYLDNPTFRGMRQQILKTFNKIYVLDLHGNVNRKTVSPDGSKDENVFDIRQGVAIMLLVRNENHEKLSLNHAHLWGSREEKYEKLIDNTVKTTAWTPVDAYSPFHLFVSQDGDLLSEYQKGWNFSEVIPLSSTGVKTHRDHFVLDFDLTNLRERISDFCDLSITDLQLAQTYNLRDTRDWKLRQRRRSLTKIHNWQKHFTLCLYRPFDLRAYYHHEDVVELPRNEVNAHLLAGENLGFVFMRQVASGDEYNHFGVARFPVDNRAFYSNRGTMSLGPLYLYATSETTRGTLFATQETSREPNLAPAFIRDITTRLGLTFIKDGRGNLTTTLGPEDIFHYAYAVFHSPTYRSRYAEFLKIDFPRLPLTSSLPLFRQLCQLGADLVALHLLEDEYSAASWNNPTPDSSFSVHHSSLAASPLQQPITNFVERQTGTTVGGMSKSKAYDKGKVYLDTRQKAKSSYFDGVPEEVWYFQIGGYQVCHKWLYDRRGTRGEPGRTLTPEDIEHYQRVVVALKETIRLMDEIDAVIEEFGGWPLIGSVKDE